MNKKIYLIQWDSFGFFSDWETLKEEFKTLEKAKQWINKKELNNRNKYGVDFKYRIIEGVIIKNDKKK